MIEVVAHGQELTSEFLDELFVSIRDFVPDRKWVQITKNHDKVIAGIKHIIDADYFGDTLEIVFNESYTHFKKREPLPNHERIYHHKPVSNFTATFWGKQDELMIKQNHWRIDRDKRIGQAKYKRKNGRKR